MEDAKRIRPIRWMLHILIPILIMSLLVFTTVRALGEMHLHLMLVCLSATAAVLEAVTLIRTRNAVSFIPLSFYTLNALVFLSLFRKSPRLITLILSIGALTFFILLMAALFTRKLKWRYREVLELAARSVNEAADGFTPRPFPAGKTNVAREDLIGFSRFLLKHVIAYPYVEEDRVVLVVPENMFPHLLGLKRSYTNSTQVAFSFNGDVAVRIIEKDYKKYTEELTFDQLCRSFGHLFVTFLELHKQGDENEIIQRMNALRFVE